MYNIIHNNAVGKMEEAKIGMKEAFDGIVTSPSFGHPMTKVKSFILFYKFIDNH